MKLLRGLLLKPTLNLLSWILRQRNGTSLIIGGPLGWTWQTTLDTTHHGALAGPANAHRHSDLADIGSDDHHARDHATRHQDGGADEIGIAGLSGEPAELTTHKGLPSAHHTKFTITEHDVVARHPLAVLDPAVCSETEADSKIATHAGVSDAHHTPTVARTIVTGNYTGTGGVSARQITTGMKCTLVVIMAGGNELHRQCVVLPGYSVGHQYTTSPGHTGLASNVYLHASDGFVVGKGSADAMNVSGQIYRYWAISA